MFIDIDEFKKSQKAKYFLAKPNYQIVSSLSDKSDDSANFKLGNVGDLSLTIPYYIEENQMMVKNENVDMVKEKMLIKMVLGTQVEWYIIDEITDESDDEKLTINAFSLPYELTHKRVSSYVGEAVTAREFLTENLSETIWKIGTIDARFDNIFRSFEVNDSNVLETIIEGAESYGALIDWNTSTRTISFLDLEKNGKYKGMTVNYGELLTSFNRNRTTDELVTRLYVYGSEDLTIHSVNPTGQGYIEDFSFFMYPFERDSNKRIIKSSYLMSDELCMALLDLEELTKVYSETFKSLTSSRSYKMVELVEVETSLADLNNELDNLEIQLDTAKATDDVELIENLTTEIAELNSLITTTFQELTSKEIEIGNIDSQIEQLNIKLQKDANFTDALLRELNLYVIEREWRDDRYIDEQELYDDAIKKFNEIREPKVVITIGLENLLEVTEEQYYWDKLVLGDYIRIKYPQMDIHYKAKIIEINYNFESGDISLTIANTTKIGTDMDSLNKILYSSQSASTLITNNKYKWDKVGEIEDEVYKLLNEEWDATKRRITAGVDNTIEIGKRGIIIQSPTYPNEVVVMQSGVIALSENYGDTWKTALTAKGIIADRLMGNVLISRNLVMTNANGDFTFDESGLKINSQRMNIRNPDGTYMTFNDFQSGISGEIKNVNASITQTATNIRQEVSADIKTVNGTITTLQSTINTGIGRIDLVVSSDNKIRSEAIASAIALTPSAINIISDNINLYGKVTFSDLDSSTKNTINNASSTASSAYSVASTASSTASSALSTANSANSTVNNWKMPTSTKINGAYIETGTISVAKLTSTNGYSTFDVQGGYARFTDSSGAYMDLSSTGVTGYNSNGTEKYKMDTTYVSSTAIKTTNKNVYLASRYDGETRVVETYNIPADGDLINYKFRPIRASTFIAYNTSGSGGNFVSDYGNVVLRSEDLSVVYLQGSEVRATIPYTTSDYVTFRAGTIYSSGYQVATQSYVQSYTSNFATQSYVTSRGYVDQNYVLTRGYYSSGSSPYFGRVTANGDGNRWLVGNAVDVGSGSYLYIRGDSGVRVTRTGTTDVYVDLIAKNITSNSFARLKTNIKEYDENAIDIVKNVKVFQYNFKDDVNEYIFDKKKVGMIWETLPYELRDENGVDSYRLVSVLWKASQEQQEFIEKLQYENDNLELVLNETLEMNDRQEERITKLEKLVEQLISN